MSFKSPLHSTWGCLNPHTSRPGGDRRGNEFFVGRVSSGLASFGPGSCPEVHSSVTSNSDKNTSSFNTIVWQSRAARSTARHNNTRDLLVDVPLLIAPLSAKLVHRWFGLVNQRPATLSKLALWLPPSLPSPRGKTYQNNTGGRDGDCSTGETLSRRRRGACRCRSRVGGQGRQGENGKPFA